MPKDVVLSVMSVDRIGIVAGVTGAIAELGGNIDAISQTVVRGYFTIIVTVHFETDTDLAALAQAIKGRAPRGEFEVALMRRLASEPPPAIENAERFILTLTGPDRRGVIHRVSSYLSSRNVNIEDLYACIEEGQFRLIAQLQVPPGIDVEHLQVDLESLWPDDQMRGTLQHEDIFLAINEVEFRHMTP